MAKGTNGEKKGCEWRRPGKYGGTCGSRLWPKKAAGPKNGGPLFFLSLSPLSLSQINVFGAPGRVGCADKKARAPSWKGSICRGLLCQRGRKGRGENKKEKSKATSARLGLRARARPKSSLVFDPTAQREGKRVETWRRQQQQQRAELTMPLLPSDAASRPDPDGRIAGRAGAEGGGSNVSGGSADGGSSYYQMFMRAIHAGGLHGGIFRDEAPLTLLRCMERAAHECLAHVDDALVRKGFVGHVYEEALGRALDTFGAWTGAMLDEETQRIVDAHPQVDTVLFRSVCAAYVREVHADILRTGQRASIRLPVFGDFVREFFRHLASDPYVRSAAYFDRTRLAERKLVHADAVRASLEQCMRNKVTFVAAPPPTPTATSSTASTYATSPVSTSSTTSSSSSTSSSSTSTASSASSTPSTGSASAQTPSTSTPTPRAAPSVQAPSGSLAVRGSDTNGTLGLHGALPARGMASAGDSPIVGKGDSMIRPRERPPATPPLGAHRPAPVRAPLLTAPPRTGPTFAPGDFGPIANGRLEHEDNGTTGRQRPQIAHAFAGPQDTHRSDRPRLADGGRPTIAPAAYGAAVGQDSTIDVTSATDGDHRDDDSDGSFGDHGNTGDRNPDFRQGLPAAQLARGAMAHRRDTTGAPHIGALQAPVPDSGWGAPGHRMPTTGAPPAPLAPPQRRGAHARPSIRLVDELAAPRFAPQNYGGGGSGAPSSRHGYAFQQRQQRQQHAGAYGAMDRNGDKDRHLQDEDDYGDHHDHHNHHDDDDDDDDDDVNDDDEQDDGAMQDDSRDGIYANDGQWSG
ncbi:hypothetical protein TW95_gp1456 [Pandoravirus inopinatum]|uniref:Uncharacterized protein n=1 Tax=Pandoravirus inopinatum TaxID=1605721 RepID=A0A0B5J8G6_9VIRU|nr:hypothetical protein TW95_gp1456 [Pandoravirus inopinatum]AJF98190.1 hypothetical protein [Pandoravirus inopinatum]